MSAEADKLKEACKVVEEYARRVGPDCEVIFMTNKDGTSGGVQVAPLGCGGACVEPTLYEALQDAWKSR